MKIKKMGAKLLRTLCCTFEKIFWGVKYGVEHKMSCATQKVFMKSTPGAINISLNNLYCLICNYSNYKSQSKASMYNLVSVGTLDFYSQFCVPLQAIILEIRSGRQKEKEKEKRKNKTKVLERKKISPLYFLSPSNTYWQFDHQFYF